MLIFQPVKTMGKFLGSSAKNVLNFSWGVTKKVPGVVMGMPSAAQNIYKTSRAAMGGLIDTRNMLQNNVAVTAGWFHKRLQTIANWPKVTGGLVAGGTVAYNLGSSLVNSSKFRTVGRPSSMGSGPGYITWGKTRGMPANHLSTNGLSLSLSNLRHTSTI